ncbi:DUF1853 family protein [Neptuniibacter marinus]|uniref:DUF1853 family protein n=1 Tax=Neptuniibacter marinus TaxID=1806670 RepID=UPI00083233E7|nr:DUF1853 family protein [Neptuniibacter marinus]
MIDDLFWILKCPSLIKLTNDEITSAVDWINEVETPLAFEALEVASTHNRIGYYYEQLVNQIINKQIQPIELKRNIQVIEQKKTLGEYDFLGRTEQYDFHLECAVKFYLCVGDGSQLSHFIGPNKRDRLDRKHQRLLNHQLRLSDSPAGRAQCEVLNIHPSKKLMLLQGYLFYHLSQPCNLSTLHPEINPDHKKGWWIKQQEQHLLSEQFNYAILEKPYWLSPKVNSLKTLNQFKLVIDGSDKPLLVVRFDKTTGGEVDRGFIVPNQWCE